jgi:hypothetical protein
MKASHWWSSANKNSSLSMHCARTFSNWERHFGNHQFFFIIPAMLPCCLMKNNFFKSPLRNLDQTIPPLLGKHKKTIGKRHPESPEHKKEDRHTSIYYSVSTFCLKSPNKYRGLSNLLCMQLRQSQ